MDEYIKREDVISAMCFGCNQQFSDEPCEPNECALRQAINAVPTANVAPKSEVESVLNEIEKTIRAALILVGFSYKHNPKEIQCKKECYEDFLGYIAELKKKYTEGEING